MKLGLLSDAHGNVIATEACLDALRAGGADELVFLGDACGYLPGSREVLALLDARGVHQLLGNHDAMVAGLLAAEPDREPVYRHAAARAALGPAGLADLARRVPWREWTVDGRRLLCVHGSPWHPLAGYVYPDAALDPFAQLPYDAVFMGHTHRPFVAATAGPLVVNVGSCGLPRDAGDLAACAVYDTSSGQCEIVRIRFDAAELIGQAGPALHDSVRACLMRVAPEPVVGREIER